MEEFDFFEELKQSLEEAVAFKHREHSRCRVSVVEVPIPSYQADDVARIRAVLNLSQRGLAAALGVSVRTVEAWEVGKNPPSGPASHLLYLLEQEPELAERFLIFKDVSVSQKESLKNKSYAIKDTDMPDNIITFPGRYYSETSDSPKWTQKFSPNEELKEM